MDMFNLVEKSSEKIEDGCKLADRVVDSGDDTQILSLEKYISKQLMMLMNSTPKLDVTVNIEFESNLDTFTSAIREKFGAFKKPTQSAVNAMEHQEEDAELSSLQVKL